jgi:hypothetical protein
MEISFTHITDEIQSGWLQTDKYFDGNMSVQLMTLDQNRIDEPYATLSCNLGKLSGVTLGKGEFFAKTYSENTGLLEQFVDNGLFEDTGREASVPFGVPVPIYKFNG